VVTLLVAVVLIGGGAGALYLFKNGGLSSRAAGGNGTRLETPEEAAKAARNPYAKYIEVTGIRISENPKKQLEVKVAVVNHSLAALPDLTVNVKLRSTRAAPGEPPIASFKVTVPSMAPLETRDVKTVTSTSLRAYELPDWQFLTADFTVEK
jgi:hypothetical protein